MDFTAEVFLVSFLAQNGLRNHFDYLAIVGQKWPKNGPFLAKNDLKLGPFLDWPGLASSSWAPEGPSISRLACHQAELRLIFRL